MAAEQGDDDDIFVYMGGDQRVPDGVRRAKIHISVKIVLARAFRNCRQLISVEFHDGIEIIEEDAFHSCRSLKGVKLLGVRNIKAGAFWGCKSMTDAEFGDNLETIEKHAFHVCFSLKNIRIPSVRTVGSWAFFNCNEISDMEFGEELETVEHNAFEFCPGLRRIALPLKYNVIENDAFGVCEELTTIDLVGGIHNTVASLHMESWRHEMNNEINCINEVLPTLTQIAKTPPIQQWMRNVIHRLDHYKAEHLNLLKEATTLLELALWKANLVVNPPVDKEGVSTTRGSRKRARKEICVTSGASIVIKNVLPFLQLLE